VVTAQPENVGPTLGSASGRGKPRPYIRGRETLSKQQAVKGSIFRVFLPAKGAPE